MSSFASITLVGNVCQSVRMGQAGEYQVANFTLAVNEKVKGEEIATFYECAVFGKGAAVIEQYVTKGGSLMVQGKPRLETYQGKDGTTKSKITVNVKDFTLLGSKRDSNEQDTNVTQVTHSAPVVTKPAGPGLADEIKAKLADAKAAHELRAKAFGKAPDANEPPF